MAHKVYVYDGRHFIPLSFSTSADTDAFKAWFREVNGAVEDLDNDLFRLLAAFGEGVTTDEAVRRLDALRAALARENEDDFGQLRVADCADALFAPYPSGAPNTVIAPHATTRGDHKEAT